MVYDNFHHPRLARLANMARVAAIYHLLLGSNYSVRN